MTISLFSQGQQYFITDCLPIRMTIFRDVTREAAMPRCQLMLMKVLRPLPIVKID
jgi:hypothetical protein